METGVKLCMWVCAHLTKWFWFENGELQSLV